MLTHFRFYVICKIFTKSTGVFKLTIEKKQQNYHKNNKITILISTLTLDS